MLWQSYLTPSLGPARSRQGWREGHDAELEVEEARLDDDGG